MYTIESQTEEISVTVINGIKNVTHTFTNVEHTPGYNVMGGNNQHMTQTLCNSDGDDCNLASLAPITFLTTEQKQYIIDHTGGVWNTYKPAALAYNTKRDAIVQNQVFDVGVAGNGPIPADSVQFGDAVDAPPRFHVGGRVAGLGEDAAFECAAERDRAAVHGEVRPLGEREQVFRTVRASFDEQQRRLHGETAIFIAIDS